MTNHQTILQRRQQKLAQWIASQWKQVNHEVLIFMAMEGQSLLLDGKTLGGTIASLRRRANDYNRVAA